MTQPPPHLPPYPQYNAGPPPDDGKKFLNMSAGMLALVISGVIVLCCIGPFLLCMFGGFIGAISPAPASSY